MRLICKNCAQQCKGKFCSYCGQSVKTHKINFRFLQHDIQEGLFHFEKGVPYTLKELFTRPGHSIREFLEGKRVQHFRPFSLVILLATIYGFLKLYFNIESDVHIQAVNSDFITNARQWVSNHYALFTLLLMPLYALSTYLTFRKQGYNYLEHLVITAFVSAQALVINILFLPIEYFKDLQSFGIVISLLQIIVFTWTFCQFFNTLKKRQVVLRILLYWLIIVIVVGSLLILWLIILGIDDLKITSETL